MRSNLISVRSVYEITSGWTYELYPGGQPEGESTVYRIMGKEGLEPSRLAALDPKSSLSASSSTSPA